MGSLMIFFLWIVAVVIAARAYWAWLHSAYKVPERADEIHLVTTSDLWRIRLYRRRPKDGVGEPVLLCHGFGGNRFNFHFPPGACLVDTLVEHGFDCWLIELRSCRSAEPPYGQSRNGVDADDFLLRDLPAAIRRIREVTGYRQVHWVGHSMGGMLLYAYLLASGPDEIADGVTLGSPPGFEGLNYHPHRLALAVMKYARPVVNAMVLGLTPLFAILRPKSAAFPVNYDNLHPDVDGRLFFNIIEIPPYRAAQAFDYWLTHKVWRMQGGKLDVTAGLSTLPIPLFVIYGGADPLVPLDQAQNFYDSLPNPDKQMLVLSKENGYAEDYGHGDLAFGRTGKEDVFEPIVEWLRAHPLMGEGSPMVTQRRSKRQTATKKAARRAAFLKGTS